MTVRKNIAVRAIDLKGLAKPANNTTDFFILSANPFAGLEQVKYENAPTAPVKPVHKCPACLNSWIDETGKFSACPQCLYRIVPRTPPTTASKNYEAKVKRVRERELAHKNCLYKRCQNACEFPCLALENAYRQSLANIRYRNASMRDRGIGPRENVNGRSLQGSNL